MDLKNTNWYSDTTSRAAISVRNSENMPIGSHKKKDGYVWIVSENSAIIICYLSPNDGIATFHQKLNGLEDLIGDFDGEIILANDFNAKSTEWRATWSDTRGRELAKMAANLDLTMLNEGNSTTFSRPGYREMIPDVTLASSGIATIIKNWKVLEDYMASDHQYIRFQNGKSSKKLHGEGKNKQKKGWKVIRLDPAVLTEDTN